MIPIKNAKEVEKMRQSCRTASEILDRVSELVRPGVSTKEVDEAAADFMNEAKVKSAFLGYRLGHRVFPGNICISLNDEVVHGIGSQRRIQYGDIVKLDIGVIKEGWVGDTAQTIPVGVVDERTDQLLRVTERALERAISVADEGVRLGDICAEIEDEASENRFSVVREFVGHGVGRKLHEEPQIPNYGRRGSGPKLKAGMTLSDEIDADSVSEKRISSHVTAWKLRKNGKVVETGRRTVSRDGRTLTMIQRGTDAQGKKFTDVSVFDKE